MYIVHIRVSRQKDKQLEYELDKDENVKMTIDHRVSND